MGLEWGFNICVAPGLKIRGDGILPAPIIGLKSTPPLAATFQARSGQSPPAMHPNPIRTTTESPNKIKVLPSLASTTFPSPRIVNVIWADWNRLPRNQKTIIRVCVTSTSHSPVSALRWLSHVGIAVASGWGLIQMAVGQEAVRASLAGEASAAAQRKSAGAVGYYNLRAGDLRMRLQAGSEIEFNSNVNLAAQNRKSDLILRPLTQTTLVYPLTERNMLNLSVGAGYSYYLKTDNLSRYFITPGSELSFDVYVGDCVINIHDRFSVSQDAYQNPATTGSGNVGTFDNMAGVSTTWDLNDLIVMAGYDHLLRRATTSSYSQQDASSHALHGNAGLKLNPFSTLGIEVGTTLIDRQTLSGGVQYNVGMFYRSQISEYLSLQSALGYTLYQLDSPALAGGKDQINAAYGSLAVQHRVNRIVSYSLEGGRDLQIGLFSDVLDLYFGRLQANWNLIRNFSLTTHLTYEWGTESGGAGDKITRYGGGIGLGRTITEKLSARLYYDVLQRSSDLPGRNYLQHRTGLSLNYSF